MITVLILTLDRLLGKHAGYQWAVKEPTAGIRGTPIPYMTPRLQHHSIIE